MMKKRKAKSWDAGMLIAELGTDIRLTDLAVDVQADQHEEGTDILLTDLAVDAQADQHEEEEEGKELGRWHGGEGLRVDDKHQARACNNRDTKHLHVTHRSTTARFT